MEIENRTRCRNCGSRDLYYYDGCLGYEAIKCRVCGEEHTNDNPVVLD